MDETTGLPTNRLTQVALDECRRIGSSSQTVDDILSRGGDHKVLKMLQKGIDAVNKRAPSKIHKVCNACLFDDLYLLDRTDLVVWQKCMCTMDVDIVCAHVCMCVSFLYSPTLQIARWSILEQDFSIAGGELSKFVDGCTFASKHL